MPLLNALTAKKREYKINKSKEIKGDNFCNRKAGRMIALCEAMEKSFYCNIGEIHNLIVHQKLFLFRVYHYHSRRFYVCMYIKHDQY